MAAEQTFTAQELRAFSPGRSDGLTPVVVPQSLVDYAASLRERLDGLEVVRKALQSVGWIGSQGGIYTARCAWCHGWETNPAMDVDYYGRAGHKPDCLGQRALALLDPAPVLSAGKEE